MIFTTSFLFSVLGFFVAIIAILVTYFKWTYTYWKRKGVETLTPTIPFGNATSMFFGEDNFGNIWETCYNNFKEKGLPYGGGYFFSQKVFIPTDLELVKSILTKDYDFFRNRFRYVDEKLDPLSGNLFSTRSTKWKRLREKFSPAFSPAKLKMMYETIITYGDTLTDFLDARARKNVAVDIKDVCSCYLIDIIGSVAFGLDINSLENPDSDFYKYGNMAFRHSFIENIMYLLQNFIPEKYLRLFRYKATKPDVEKFFVNTARATVDYREQNNIYRKDFMQLLLQLKNTGKLTDDGKIGEEKHLGLSGLTFNELSAQVYIFFIAGYETTSTTLSFALWELASNQNIQKKLREEVRIVLEKNKGKIPFESLSEIHYLEKVIIETLRKYPPTMDNLRYCNKDYKVADSNLIIEKGTMVAISIFGIHRDKEYYPNPETFDPERFNEENKRTRPSCSWIPFGDGPRYCIGQTFAMMVLKFSLATIIRNFELSLNEKSVGPIKFDNKAWILIPADGVWLNLKKVN